jgi:hypothetical protein
MATPSIRWDAQIGRFRYPSGMLVSAVQVRSELDKSLLATGRRVKSLGDDLRAGRISLDAWRVEMKQSVKDTHLRASALARGGWDQMTPTDFGRAGQRIKQEYGFLEKWVGEIRAGAPLDGRLGSRGQLYAAAARSTFHQVQAEEMLKRGMDLEKSVLHPAEHCQVCVDEAAAGFRPIGEMIPIGERTCGRNCKCSVVYQRTEAA